MARGAGLSLRSRDKVPTGTCLYASAGFGDSVCEAGCTLMFDRLDDTIVAISSPAGCSPRGIIRLSGPASLRLAGVLFTCQSAGNLDAAPGHRRFFGRMALDSEVSIPAELYVFRAPASYTRQDVAELHTIGSPPVLAMAVEALVAAGARPAEPGEFTARAFFSGAMDLTRVEGVAAVIHARNDSQLRASQALLHGHLSRQTLASREQLAELLALVEAQIDFVEESIDFVSQSDALAVVDRVQGEIEQLIGDSSSMERLEVLPEVLLVGQPNAGKSTLFNRLTGMDRAIRSATAGTTRDLLGAPAELPGGEIMLVDTAGLETPESSDVGRDGGHPDSLAQSVTRKALSAADLLIAVVDVMDKPEEVLPHLQASLGDRPCLVVLNKIDLAEEASVPQKILALSGGRPILPVSADTGAGITELRQAIGELLFESATSRGADHIVLSSRQRDALNQALSALRRAGQLCRKSREIMAVSELIAIELREAIDALSLLTGRVTTEDLLGRIFARFCIGK